MLIIMAGAEYKIVRQAEVEELNGVPAEIQSLDPERPVAEVAYDNIHYIDYGFPDFSTLDLFIKGLLRSRVANRDGLTYKDAGLDPAYSISDYTDALLKEHPDNQGELERRRDMWFACIGRRVFSLSKQAANIESDLRKLLAPEEDTNSS
jgi:hypothetical protein